MRRLLIWRAILLFFLVGIAAPSLADDKPLVLFDAAHGERFAIDQEGALDLSRMAGIFRQEGLSVVPLAVPFSAETLAKACGVVISGPFIPASPDEIEALLRFLDNGGNLAIMLHIAPPMAPLIAQLGGTVSNGVMRESEQVLGDDPLQFRVTRLSSHPLLDGVESFTLHGGWALLAQKPGTVTIAATSPSAWIDLDRNGMRSPPDAVQSFGVILAGVVGRGRFVVFGDDAIFQNKFLVEGNERLARNLAKWFLAESGSGGYIWAERDSGRRYSAIISSSLK